jgi:hypothetical protein
MNGTATMPGAASEAAPSLARRARVSPGQWLAVGACLIVVGIAEGQGGYFPTAWGWCVLPLAWVAGLVLIVSGRVELGRTELAFLGWILAFVGLMALSILWTSDVDASVQEVERGLIYVVAVFVAILVVRERLVANLLAGMLAGIVWISAQALVGRLYPGSGPGSEELLLGRLSDPVGYFNALGMFAAMGALLAIGFAVHGQRPASRAAAAAALPILLTTTYFTFSRGALLALVVGLVSMVALDARRLKLLTIGPLVILPAAAAVWLASRSHALASATATRTMINADGPKLALMLLAMTVASAAITMQIARLETRVRPPRELARAYGAVLACAALVLVAGVVVHYGGPSPLVHNVYDHVNANPTSSGGDPNDLNARLGNISSVGRIDHWRVALHEHRLHPWLGSGAGTWEQFWQRYRPAGQSNVRDAHSIYFEALGQLGWTGLAIVLVMLLVPVAAALRARRNPLVAAAFGAYVAYLVHTGIDWDWEVPAVTLVALLCGAVLTIAATDQAATRRAVLPAYGRWLTLAAICGLAAFSLVGLVGNRALTKAGSENDGANFQAAEADARTATHWAPWSADALDELGRAQAGVGDRAAGQATLRRAASKTPRNWQIWYDLGTASRGRARDRAFVRAARLNPREADIEVLRTQHYRLPAAGR